LSPGAGFLTALVVTLAFLGCAVVTGRAAKRKKHLCCVSGAVISLLVSIYFAEKTGELYDLESAGWIYPFHLLIARVSTASYLVVIASGIATIRQASRRKTHGRIAYSVLGLTVLTAVTGVWMLSAATPL